MSKVSVFSMAFALSNVTYPPISVVPIICIELSTLKSLSSKLN